MNSSWLVCFTYNLNGVDYFGDAVMKTDKPMTAENFKDMRQNMIVNAAKIVNVPPDQLPFAVTSMMRFEDELTTLE
jgi:hypothetical protein